jgi:hypothetical protein
MNKRVNDIKLGDKILRGNINSKGFTVGDKNHVKDYRVIGLNPIVKIQQVIIKKGWEELGEIIEIDNKIVNRLRPLFSSNHFVYSMFGGDWSHVWVCNF